MVLLFSGVTQFETSALASDGGGIRSYLRGVRVLQDKMVQDATDVLFFYTGEPEVEEPPFQGLKKLQHESVFLQMGAQDVEQPPQEKPPGAIHRWGGEEQVNNMKRNVKATGCRWLPSTR